MLDGGLKLLGLCLSEDWAGPGFVVSGDMLITARFAARVCLSDGETEGVNTGNDWMIEWVSETECVSMNVVMATRNNDVCILRKIIRI